MVENLPEINLNDIDSDASGSDAEIVPLDFRTAVINNKLVIQARPKQYLTLEQEMEAIEKGRFSDLLGPEGELDPDVAIRDLDEYLKSVRKEPFDINDDNVVLIDPGNAAETRYKDIQMLCDSENRINNSLNAPKRDQSVKAERSMRELMQPGVQDGRVLNSTLRQAERQSAQLQPDYYEKQIAAEKEAFIRSQLPKGPVFAQPPKQKSDDEGVGSNSLMSFNEILSNVGGLGFLSSGNESEEEKKAPPSDHVGVRVFRAQRFSEDSITSKQQENSTQD